VSEDARSSPVAPRGWPQRMQLSSGPAGAGGGVPSRPGAPAEADPPSSSDGATTSSRWSVEDAGVGSSIVAVPAAVTLTVNTVRPALMRSPSATVVSSIRCQFPSRSR
jgi:hypothetical protein